MRDWFTSGLPLGKRGWSVRLSYLTFRQKEVVVCERLVYLWLTTRQKGMVVCETGLPYH